MDRKQINYLICLSDRAINSRVVSEGSANVVIYKAEFDALEEAIEELQRGAPPPK